MEINKLLDRCMERTGAKSDYALAKDLELHTALISMYRSGKRIPDSYACIKIAEVLEMDALKLICYYEALSAKNPKNRDFLQKKLADLGGLAASIFFVVTFIMTPTPSQAAPALNPINAVCILC